MSETESAEAEAERRDSIRCSDTKFLSKVLKRIGEPARRRILKNSPFSSLLQMKGGLRHDRLIFHVAGIFDVDRCSITVNGCEYVVTPADFTEITGLADGEEKYEPLIQQDDKLRKLYYNKGLLKAELNKKNVTPLLNDKNPSISMMAFEIMCLLYVIVAPRRGSLAHSYLYNLAGAKSRRWASHGIDSLVRGIRDYRASTAKFDRYLGGCTLFLQLFFIKKSGLTPPLEEARFLTSLSEERVREFWDETEAAMKGDDELLEEVMRKFQQLNLPKPLDTFIRGKLAATSTQETCASQSQEMIQLCASQGEQIIRLQSEVKDLQHCLAETQATCVSQGKQLILMQDELSLANDRVRDLQHCLAETQATCVSQGKQIILMQDELSLANDRVEELQHRLRGDEVIFNEEENLTNVLQNALLYLERNI